MRWPGSAGEIGIVFQAFHLIPTMTALENVAVPLELAGRRRRAAPPRRRCARSAWATRLTHLPGQLSGGEQQRVALARAFAPRPRAAAGRRAHRQPRCAHRRRRAWTLLFELQRLHGTALLLITHDAALAARCDRRLAVAEGCLHALEPSAA